MYAQTDVNRGEFTWKISNFNELISPSLFSEAFTVSGCPWIILVYPNGNGSLHLSMYLQAADPAAMPNGWTKFSLSVIDQINNARSIKIETQHYFTTSENPWGYSSFMPLTLLRDPRRGFIANNTLVIKAEVCVLAADDSVNIQPARPTDSFDTYFNGLEELINGAETNGASVGSSSCHQDGDSRAEIPSLEEVEKAKQSLKEGLSHLFKLKMKESLIEALSTLSSAKTRLTSEQQIAIEAFGANFNDFTFDFSTFEQDNTDIELHKLQKDQKLSTMKKCHKTHVLYKQLMDDLIKEEEEVKSRRDKLLSDWEILLVKAEEAKSGYKDEQKKVAEVEEEKKRIAVERMYKSITAWSNLKAQFC
ncbi:MATH domain and coiled-coil domain-containing protein At3g58270-like [Rhodamnia argentea]|uniref:MATH domain and coiled-coil domain-containing protein At3g58270-like n=1 Tax=Rhodamnia argentea TaxID=178133 RepID=A0ABM3GVR1_9MYRT|nr:MATH domain and coiled-coil domain-containing protein At3g58270-like [Rhodamnia argentea]